MANACACCAGMVKHAGQVLKKGDKPVVGVTLMGITNTGACAAIDELERLGIETIGVSFHRCRREHYGADGGGRAD